LNLSQRAGFSQLAERILIARKDAALAIDKNEPVYHERLMSLVNFYSERGAYLRVAESLERERSRDQWQDKFNYRSMIAEYERLGGDRESELKVLREEFAASMGKPTTTTNPMIERYFEALLEQGDAGRDELRRCVQSQTSHRFQLIGFLLRNEELKLAREAVEAAPQSAAWKSSRQAEISLAARDLSRDNEDFFLRALNWKTIGEMVVSKPDQSGQMPQQMAQHLVGDNWFYLAEGYGRWLAVSEKAKQPSKVASATFLPALTENRPQDSGAQRRLAIWYSGQGEHLLSLEHFQLALEMNPGNDQTIADIGSAYFKLGKRQEAYEYWSKIIAGDKPGVESLALYLRTLGGHGLAAEARAKLKPLVVKRFNDAGRSDKEMESLKSLIRALARSFGKEGEDGVVPSPQGEAEKAAFLPELCDSAPSALSPAEMAISEPLVKREHFAPFYEKIIRDAKGISRYSSDADFVDRLRRRASWSLDEVEESLDHEGELQSATQVHAQDSHQFGARVGWRQKYLDYLIAERRNAEALGLIPRIEQEFKGRYARPEWLRLAKLRLGVRQGRVAQALTGLKRFAGIEASPKLERVAPPNIERLNAAAATLRAENRRAEADQLLQAAYERDIALEQLQT